MQRSEMLSVIGPLLRHRTLGALVVVAPGITAGVAILTAAESNLALAIILNIAAGIVISSAIFIAVSIVARQIADERVFLAQAGEEGLWRARTQLLSIHHDESGLYADWYFRLRVQEEVERARRYGLQFVVLLLEPLGLHRDSEAQAASAGFGDHIRRHLRSSDLPALLRDGSLGVMLPHTGRHGAVQFRLARALASEDVRIGLACFPGDGEDAAGLLTAAAHAAIREPQTGVA